MTSELQEEPVQVAAADVSSSDGPSPVKVRFGSSPFMAIPAWAQWAIDVGKAWKVGEKRRIAVLSMPCDSPAAGLVALGCMCGGLADSAASDIAGHFDELVRHAKQYLEACRDCDTRCRPRERRCGYSSEATGRLRHVGGGNPGVVLGVQEGDVPQIILKRGTGSVRLFPAGRQSYFVNREPPIVTDAAEALHPDIYETLSGIRAEPKNLQQTYSGLCLAGRATGERATQAYYDSVQFSIQGRDTPLSQVLTIAGWGRGGPSRMTYFNSRTGQSDRHSSFHRLVIADGTAAVDKVLSTRDFDRSDVIGVIHRTANDDESRSLGERLVSMRQWYTCAEDPQILLLPPVQIRRYSLARWRF